MKFLALFFVVVLLAVSVFAAPASDDEQELGLRRCVPGKSYFDGCNRCGCKPNGYQFCTFKVCPGQETVEAPEDFWLNS